MSTSGMPRVHIHIDLHQCVYPSCIFLTCGTTPSTLTSFWRIGETRWCFAVCVFNAHHLFWFSRTINDRTAAKVEALDESMGQSTVLNLPLRTKISLFASSPWSSLPGVALLTRYLSSNITLLSDCPNIQTNMYSPTSSLMANSSHP